MTVERARARKWLKAALLFLLQAAAVAYVSVKLFDQRAEIGRVLDFGWGTLVGLVALFAVGHLQRTVEVTYTLRRLGVNEPFGDGFLLTGAGFLLNHLPLNAGLLMRAAILKRDYALPYASYASIAIVNGLMNLAVAALSSLLVVLFAPPIPGGGYAVVALLAAIVTGSALAVWLPASWVPAGGGFVLGRLRTLTASVALIRGNGSGLVWLATLALTKVMVVAVRLSLCFAALKADVPAGALLLLASTSVVLQLVNVTPGNLGLRELLLSVIALQLGTTQTLGMAAATLDRVVSLAYVLLVGLPSLSAMKRRVAPLEGSGRVEPSDRSG